MNMQASSSKGDVIPNHDVSSDEDDHLEDPEETGQSVCCIFTGDSYPNAQTYFTALKNIHDFDIWQIVLSDLCLGFFGYVKLINYMRENYFNKTPPSSEELEKSRNLWEADEFLRPVIQDDPLLQFILDDNEGFSDEDFENDLNQKIGSQENCSGECSAEIYFLKDQIKKKDKLNEKLNLELQNASNQIAKMKSFMQDVVLTGDVHLYRPVAACRKDLPDLEDEEYEDSGYFGTYSHHDIHSEMLQDKVRTLSYKNAILDNLDRFKGKIVLDVGCGTGILSMFAAQAGADHVYGIDMSEIAYQAMEIIRENGFGEKITILKGRVEEISLPVTKVDIIISEWMGYFLLYESMLDSVLFAKDKWLTSNGEMLPSRCTISLQAMHDEKLRSTHVTFWEDVYGFQMSSLKTNVINEGLIQVINPSFLVSQPAVVHDIDINRVETKQLNYKCEFFLKITKNGLCSAIVGYFDVYSGEISKKKLMFSTSPTCTPTHWKQTVFFLKDAIPVKEGETISCKIDCHKNVKDPRSLVVVLTVKDETQTYKIE